MIQSITSFKIIKFITWLFFAKSLIHGDKVESNFLIPSLFPNVAPYIDFSHKDGGTHGVIPPIISKHLKWGKPHRKSYYNFLIEILSRAGLDIKSRKDFTGSNDWFGGWTTKRSLISKNHGPLSTKPYKKSNYFPGIREIGAKHTQWINIRRIMSRKDANVSDFPFVIPAFIYPDEFYQFKVEWESNPEKIWITKPVYGSLSKGIKLINHWNQLQLSSKINGRLIIQKYLEKPYLYRRRKVEIRYYVLVPSINPLRLYIHDSNLLKFALRDFTIDPSTLGDPCIHTQGKEEKCGSKEGEVRYTHEYYDLGFDRSLIQGLAENAAILTIISSEDQLREFIANDRKFVNRYNGFHFFSFDFLIDEDLNLKLLEINGRPVVLTLRLIADCLTMGGFQLPPTLSTKAQKIALDIIRRNPKSKGLTNPAFDERLYSFELTEEDSLKENFFSKILNKFEWEDLILQNLTRNDIRTLIMAEDELERSKLTGFKRIWPSENMDKYFNYVESDSDLYYFKLLSTWEKLNIRSQGRKYGIDRLSKLAEQMKHLN